MAQAYTHSELVPGAVLGHYTVIEHVADGGMGHVYKGYEPSLQREVAIKVLKREFSEDPEQLLMFESEAQNIAALRHANIVPIYFVGHQGQIYYFVMPYVTGHTLDDWIDNGRRMTEVEAAWAMHQAIDALDKAYSMGIIHLDIKPSNFLIDSDGVLLLTDFGLAKSLSGSGSANRRAFGTPAYMCPEQITRQPTDQRSDIYSLGATIYHLMTSKFLYDADTITGVVKGHVYRPFPVEEARASGLPAGWINLLERMCRKDPAERFQNYQELREALVMVKKLPPPKVTTAVAGLPSPYLPVSHRGDAPPESIYGLLGPRYSNWAQGAIDQGIMRERGAVLRGIDRPDRPSRIDAAVEVLREMFGSGEPEMDDLAEVVAQFESLDAYFLEMANTRLVNPAQERLETRRKALRAVGLGLANKIAYAQLVAQETLDVQVEFDWTRFWAYSISVGIFNKYLCDVVQGEYVLGTGWAKAPGKKTLKSAWSQWSTARAGSLAFEAGFLHAVGVPVLAGVAPYPMYTVMRQAIEAQEPLAQRARANLGVDQYEAGEMWLNGRRFDAALRTAARFYDDWARPHGLLASLTAVSSYLARYFGCGYGGDPVLPAESVWNSAPWNELAGLCKTQQLTADKMEREFLPLLAELPVYEPRPLRR